MNLQLAFKVVQVAMVTLTIANRVLIIIENAQESKQAKPPKTTKWAKKEKPNVRRPSESPPETLFPDSGS